ncbi:MAG: SDR family NAD(P)-dependent oxidoreductase [Pseudomonadota bacterium]
MTGFEGKGVVVTGASGGIGRQVALDLAAAGAGVVVHYGGSEAAAQAVVEEIQAAGGRAVACQADIAQRAEVEGLLKAGLEAFGRIELLVHSAALSLDGPFLEMPEDDWRRVIDVNLTGAFHCLQVFGRAMVEAGGGAVVNISANTAIDGRVNAANYCASKAGLNMLTQCAALELAPTVRVNGLALGFFASPLVDQLYTPEQQAEAIAAIPLGRMGRFAEVSDAVKYFGSEASGFITGQTVIMDGGRVRR